MRRPWASRDYQDIAIPFLVRTPRCNLFAGMGMGKTSAVLTALEMLMQIETQPILVLAPRRVALTTWPEEAALWSHLVGVGVMPIIGTEKQRKKALAQHAQIYTINYDNIPWLIETLGPNWRFRTAVADESTRLKGLRVSMRQTKDGRPYIVGQGGVRSKELAKVAHTKVNRWINLTGTPTPNSLLDLWGQCWFVDGGLRLGHSYSDYKKLFFNCTSSMGTAPAQLQYEPKDGAMETIQELIRDVSLTLEAKDWFDLREPVVVDVEVDMPAAARKNYKEMEDTFFTEIAEKGVEAKSAAAMNMKCRQLASGAIYTDDKGATWHETHSEKIDALDSIITEANGASILVAYYFRHSLERLKKAFPHGVEMKTGKDQDAWNAGKTKLMFVHPKSAGHGLNLQHGGHHLVYFDQDWNLEERMQVLERIGPTRQMQSNYDRPVFVYNILTRDTLDELVLLRVETKRSMQDTLMAALAARRPVLELF